MKDFLKYVFATITGIILLTIVMAILGAISLVGLAASSASTTKVEENSVFTLMLSGQVEERTQENPLASLTGATVMLPVMGSKKAALWKLTAKGT